MEMTGSQRTEAWLQSCFPSSHPPLPPWFFGRNINAASSLESSKGQGRKGDKAALLVIKPQNQSVPPDGGPESQVKSIRQNGGGNKMSKNGVNREYYLHTAKSALFTPQFPDQYIPSTCIGKARKLPQSFFMKRSHVLPLPRGHSVYKVKTEK